MEICKNMLAVLVLGYLRKYARGRAATRTQGRIARDLRDLGLNATTRGVRDAASALVLGGWPIGTSSAKPGGVFLCGTREDYLMAYRNLYKRLVAQAKRARRFKATARAALSGQRTFDFLEADSQFAELERAPLLAGAGGGRSEGGPKAEKDPDLCLSGGARAPRGGRP